MRLKKFVLIILDLLPYIEFQLFEMHPLRLQLQTGRHYFDKLLGILALGIIQLPLDDSLIDFVIPPRVNIPIEILGVHDIQNDHA